MPEFLDLHVPGHRSLIRVRMAARRGLRALVQFTAPELRGRSGLWIPACRSIHTFGTRRAVDVVFLRADGVIAKVVPGMKPWRMTRCTEACTALKLRAGLARHYGLCPGVALDLLA